MNNKLVFDQNIDSYLWIINREISKISGISELWDYIKVQWWNSFKASEYVDAGIPIIRISNFNNWKIILDEHKTKFYEESDKYKIFELNEWDIIIAMTWGTIWKLAIVQWWLWKIYLNQRVWRFQIVDNSLVSNEYLYWIARWVENIVKSMWYWWAQPNVSWKQIEWLKFPFPKKEVQEQIVCFLTDLMNWELIEKEYFNKEVEEKVFKLHEKALNIDEVWVNSSENQNYIKLLKQSILQEAIEWKLTKSWREENKNIEPASVLLKKIKAEKEELIKQKKLKKQKELDPISEDEIPFDIPESWEFCRFIDIFDVRDGTHDSPKYITEWYPLITSKNLINWRLDFNNVKYISEEDYKKITLRSFVDEDDILFAMIGSIWNPVIVKKEWKKFWIKNVALFKYYNKDLINIDYLYYFLLIIQYKLQEVAKWWIQQFVSLTILRNFLYALPPLSEQKEIVRRVGEMMELCDELEKQTLETKENSENLMKAVLGEVFSK